jgi:hypothetical protein
MNFSKGDQMEFFKDRHVMGKGRAVNISCEEVQSCHLRTLITGIPPEDRDFEAAVIAHTLVCFKCGMYLDKIIKEKEAQEVLDEEDLR